MPDQGSKRLPRRGLRTTPRGTVRLETADQRRERIVQTAWQLFLKKGYDNVSIDEIVAAVGRFESDHLCLVRRQTGSVRSSRHAEMQ